ncbi:T9SS type A sorting domain-containing protein [bacterium]|nr:T9SS type A sorting domain-containing protein [bacterium]
MKTIRLLLLGSFLCFCQFAFTQNLFQDGAKYIVEKMLLSVSPDWSGFSMIQEKALLDSQVNNKYYYIIQRRPYYSEKEGLLGMKEDSFDYMVSVVDSAYFFTGKVEVYWDSFLYFKNELVFDLKLKENDTLNMIISEGVQIKYLIYNVKDSAFAKLFRLRKIEGDPQLYRMPEYLFFNSSFGFRKTGILPYDIHLPIGVRYLKLYSVCNDSLLYANKSIYKKVGIFDNFCDSLVIDSLVRGILATDIIDVKNDLAPKIYPNPFSDFVKIDLSNEFFYSIYNVDGRLIEKGSASNQINTNTLEKGMYILEIQTNLDRFEKILVKY